MENNHHNMREVTTAGTSTNNAMMMELKTSCLLCPRSCTAVDAVKALGPFGQTSSEALPESEGTSSVFDTHLWTTFILRKLLDLSKEECLELFEIGGAGGYPGIKLCGGCAQFVQQFRKRHEQLLEIEKEMGLMRGQAQGRLLGLKDGPNNRLKNVDFSGSVRERVRAYFQDASNVQTGASNQFPSSSPPSVQVAERARARVILEDEVRSEVEVAVAEERANGSQIEPVAAVVERTGDESSDSALAGEDIGAAAARSEIELGPGSAVDLPVEDESEIGGEEPLASCSSTSEPTLEKEKVWKAKITNKEEEGASGSESIHLDSSGPARRKSFQMRDRLNQSHRVRGQKKSHTCLFCGKGFLGCSNLIRHTSVHTREKPYFCKLCSQEFLQLDGLKTHVRRSHTNVRPYNCELCSKRFATSAELTNHMRVHTKEKPFKCQRCNKSFSQSANLKMHVMAKKACKKFP